RTDEQKQIQTPRLPPRKPDEPDSRRSTSAQSAPSNHPSEMARRPAWDKRSGPLEKNREASRQYGLEYPARPFGRIGHRRSRIAGTLSIALKWSRTSRLA